MRLIDRLMNGRDAHRATTLQLASGLLPDPLLSNYPTYVQEGLRGSGPVFGLISVRANAFAEARFQWQDVTTNELAGRQGLGILERPWPNGTTSDLLKRIEVDVSLAGNAYVRAVPDGVEMMRPDWVDVATAIDDRGVRRLIGYVYWPDGKDRSRSIVLLPDEVAHHVEMPDPMRPFCGMSWMTPVARDIDSDTYMTRHKVTFFTNAATPNMKLKVDRELDDPGRKLLLDQFAARHEGFENAYKTVLLEGGADLEVIGNNMRELRFDSVQAAGETRLAAAAGVPPVVVGFLQGIQAATYSNYSQAMRRYADLTVRTKWRDVAGDLETIVSRPGPNLRLWYDDADIPFLQQDAKDAVEVRKGDALTLESLIRGGFTPESAVKAVSSGKFENLEHSGLLSVQLQAPGVPTPAAEGNEEDE